MVVFAINVVFTTAAHYICNMCLNPIFCPVLSIQILMLFQTPKPQFSIPQYVYPISDWIAAIKLHISDQAK